MGVEETESSRKVVIRVALLGGLITAGLEVARILFG